MGGRLRQPGEMPRTARASLGGLCYHALNRGNRREAVFHTPGDYDAFVAAIRDARARLPVDILGYCLMPNHFHLVLRPRADGDLGRWMQWLLTAHARRYHRHYGTSGHVWQGRFNEPLSAGDLQRLRHAVARGRPFGDEAWTRATAERLGLGSCLRPRGRPRKGQP
jgi:REP element-mobilizing transposase RayT